MNVGAVIEREMRAAARQPSTYYLRFLSVLALLVAIIPFALEQGLAAGGAGRLFLRLHQVLFCAIWVLVPLVGADCISRERREGTLPLLFLTPLLPYEVITAKSAAQILRSLTLWLAVAPVLTICFLVGGVGWAEVTASLLINFSALCMATAAGMVASAWSKAWIRAASAAVCLAGVFLLAYLYGLAQTFESTTFLIGRFYGGAGPSIWNGLEMALTPDWDFAAGWGWGGPMPGTSTGLSFVSRYAVPAGVCAVFLLLAILACGIQLKRTWQENPPSARMVQLKNRLLTPVLWTGALKKWLRWELERNPIGWLERRSWSARLVLWSWFAVVICVYTSFFANLYLYQRGFSSFQIFLASLLAGSMAVSSAGSFRRERETGVLELILVSPLREWEIIRGRVWGIWLQFMPAIILLFSVWLFAATFLGSGKDRQSVMSFAILYATLPIAGLYFSLSKSHFISALLWTLVVQGFVPVAVGSVAGGLFRPLTSFPPPGPTWTTEWVVTELCRVSMAWFLATRLHTALANRSFVLAKP